MPDAGFPYPEEILQQIWQQMLFSRKGLATTCGKAIQIIQPGKLNLSDGPDFLDAKLRIDGLIWHGAVEIHLKTSGWQQHGHHKDANYNNVVLHVVADLTAHDVRCENGTHPFTLHILPYLTDKMAEFVQAYYSGTELPCAAHLHFISQDALEAQINKAHTEYLEQKTDDFFGFFDTEKLQSLAWKHALFIALFDGFGISHNREPMKKLARQLLHAEFLNREALTNNALQLAFSSAGNLGWKYKAQRPAAQPENRVRQAAGFGAVVLETSFSEFLKPDAPRLWQSWCNTLGYANTGHIKILYGTVFLPALYAAASLFAHEQLQNNVFKEWTDLQSPVPPTLLKPLHKLPVPDNTYKYKLGSVYQLRNYCFPKKCSECFVFKKAFQS